MADEYNVNLSDGILLANVAPGTINETTTSLTLIGKNYVRYGEILNENFVHLLENFSNTIAPSSPLTGQLWWDRGEKLLKLWSNNHWKTISAAAVSNVPPTEYVIGDQWFDTSVNQLKVWAGTQYGWLTVGPGFTSSQGVSGAIAEEVMDNAVPPLKHVIVKFYLKGTVVAILSNDASFTLGSAITGFSLIKPGLNLSSAGNSLAYYNDADNALKLGGTAASNYARRDIDTTFLQSVRISSNSGLNIGNSALGDLVLDAVGTSVNLKSVTSGKSINFYVAGQANPTMSISSTGQVTVAADPTTALGVATMGYVDSKVGAGVGDTSSLLKKDGTVAITGILKPDSNVTRDLGTSALRFARIYTKNVNLSDWIEFSSNTVGVRFGDNSEQTTAWTGVVDNGTITPAKLSTGAPTWLTNSNVGIGTGNPASRLSVAGGNISVASTYGLVLTGTTTSGIFPDDGTIGTKIQSQTGFRVFTGGANERLRIDSTGNVLFNSTAVLGPAIKKLQFGNASETVALSLHGPTANGAVIEMFSGTQNSLYIGGGASYNMFSAGGTGMATGAALPLLFGTNNVERVRIDASGNVGIGTNNPVAKLHINGDIFSSGTCTATYSGSQGFTDQDITKAAFYTELTHSASSYVPAIKIRTNGSSKIRFSSFGSLHNTDGTVDTVIHALDSNDTNNHAWKFTNAGAFISPGDVTAFSDITLKKDILTIDCALDKVTSLRGVRFTRKDTNTKSIGVIAQEVEMIIPEVVHSDANGIKSVAYGNLVGVLIEAVKELKAEVDALKKELGKK